MQSDVQAIMEDIRPRCSPGASLLITRNGKVLLHRGYGQAVVNKGFPAEPDSTYLIVSI